MVYHGIFVARKMLRSMFYRAITNSIEFTPMDLDITMDRLSQISKLKPFLYLSTERMRTKIKIMEFLRSLNV